MVALFAQQSNTHLPIDEVIHGDCLEVLRSLPSNSVDAIVSDPPAGIAFMGKNWDDPKAESWGAYDSPYARGNTPRYKTTEKGVRDAFIAFMTDVFTEALRVLKPGGYGLIWALPRTSHWTALALEDSGFIVKDVISHHFGSGFPKSLDISKAIDRMKGAEREKIRHKPRPITSGTMSGSSDTRPWIERSREVGYHEVAGPEPITEEAQQHAGKGTALKPSTEFWWLVQKPISEKTIAANVLKWGTGGLAIDKCRVGTDGGGWNGLGDTHRNAYSNQGWSPDGIQRTPQGRFPSHLLLSHSVWCVPRGVKRVRGANWKDSDNQRRFEAMFEGGWKDRQGQHYTDADGMEEVEDWECVEDCPVRLLNERSGIRKSGGRVHPIGESDMGAWRAMEGLPNTSRRTKHTEYEPSDGGCSRYFQTFHYFSKASRAERNQGCEGLPEQHVERVSGIGGDKVSRCPVHDASYVSGAVHYTCGCPHVYEGGTYSRVNPMSNTHPTVKSLSLMSWLCRLITPPDGIILDPFLGSGSTAVAAIHEGFHFIGIEAEAEYVAICEARIAHAMREVS